MTALTLIRTDYGSEATVGRLVLDGHLLYSIEQPWVGNLQDHSCVPDGTYELIPYQSVKHGATWCLHNPALNIYGREPVPLSGRSYCELHSANWAEQLKGCIAFGLHGSPTLDPLTGHVEPAVEQSRDAMALLLDTLTPLSEGHTLTLAPLEGLPGTG